MITYFVHATSTDNEAGIRSGWSDPSLSQKGIQQAKALRRLVADRPFAVVFASDLRRAVQTVAIAFPHTELQVDSRLREMNYGQLNGNPHTAFPVDEHRCIENRFEGGECCLDVQQRIERFLEDRYESGARVAIVAHRFPQLALEVICKGIDWRDALDQDWRRGGAWQPGWDYRLRA